jgi:hypothetical protein
MNLPDKKTNEPESRRNKNDLRREEARWDAFWEREYGPSDKVTIARAVAEVDRAMRDVA